MSACLKRNEMTEWAWWPHPCPHYYETLIPLGRAQETSSLNQSFRAMQAATSSFSHHGESETEQAASPTLTLGLSSPSSALNAHSWGRCYVGVLSRVAAVRSRMYCWRRCWPVPLGHLKVGRAWWGLALLGNVCPGLCRAHPGGHVSHIVSTLYGCLWVQEPGGPHPLA